MTTTNNSKAEKIQAFRKRYLSVIQDNAENARSTGSVKVSGNTKTGVSINVPIIGTCTPTKACGAYCYATKGPIAFPASLLSQERNLQRFNELENANEAEVEKEAKNIMKQVGAASWFRWNGVGDLTPGSVRVINAIARLYPNVTQWVVTRKPALAATLSDSKSLAILFSWDETTPAAIKIRSLEVSKAFKQALFQFSYTRLSENDVAPKEVSIIFNYHAGRSRKAWKDARVCEATLPDHEHENACNDCRRCFQK